MNSESQVKIRRFRDNLRLAGMGCIVFGIWDVVKLFMTFSMQREELDKIIRNVNRTDVSRQFIILVCVVLFLILSVIVMSIHTSVGIGAIRYSKGRKKHKTFVIGAAAFMILTITTLPVTLKDSGGDQITITPTVIASLIADITLAYILFDMIVSAFLVDRYTKLTGGRI